MHDMTTLIEAARQALEALDTAYYQTCSVGRQKDWHQITKAITALRTAIAEAEKQEPVAQDVQEKCRIETVPAKGGLLPAAPVQEPEQWEHLKAYGYAPGNYMMICRGCNTEVIGVDKRASRCKPCAIKAAAQRQWVGLTDAEILKVLCIWPDADDDPDDYMEDIREARAIEAKLREKNSA
jgi:hypothetical protein